MLAIATIASARGPITVFKHRKTGILSYAQGGCEQSVADAAGISLAAYIHALYGLVLNARAGSVLVVGCGGGTLARMLVGAGVRTTIVDVDPASFELARWYFGLPEACECHVADGREFLRTSERQYDAPSYDAIVLDAYDAATMPDHLCDDAFFRLVKTRLSPGGALFVNAFVRDDGDDFARQTAATLRNVWQSTRMLDSKGNSNRNAILMAGAVAKLARPTLTLAPQYDGAEIDRDLRLLKFTSFRARRRPARHLAPAGKIG